MSQLKPLKGVHSCQICHQIHEKGILIKGHFLCSSCEKKLLATVPADPAYEALKDQIKIMLFQPASQEA